MVYPELHDIEWIHCGHKYDLSSKILIGPASTLETYHSIIGQRNPLSDTHAGYSRRFYVKGGSFRDKRGNTYK